MPDLLNKKINDIYLDEIAYNKDAFEKNFIFIKRQNNIFNLGIIIIAATLVISMFLLLIDIVVKDKINVAPSNEHSIIIENINYNNYKLEGIMPNDNEKEKKEAQKTENEPKIKNLPTVDEKKTIQFNENEEQPQKKKK